MPKPIVLVCLLALAAAPAFADVTYEDMARVYQELDEAFLARRGSLTEADHALLTRWVTEGILAFWTKDYAGVVRSFARARQLVRGEAWDVDTERLDAVSLRIASPSVGASAGESTLRIVDAYEPWTAGPVTAVVEVYAGTIADPAVRLLRESRTMSPAELATGWTVAFPIRRDRTLVRVELASGAKRQSRTRFVYRVDDLAGRIRTIREGIDAIASTAPDLADDLRSALVDLEEQVDASVQTPTWLDLIDLLERLEADVLAAGAGADPLAGRTGVVPRGARTPAGDHVLYRVVLPADYDPSRSYPVVVALHGLGIDERTMTHTYGAGALAAEATRRGYVFVAPRSSQAQTTASLTFTHRTENDHVLAALADAARHYSIDLDRAYVFGHSLGAIQALQTASRSPGTFRAVVAVGLTAVVDPTKLREVPVLMLWGDEDPMQAVIQPFVLAARVAGCDRLETRIVPNMGHVLILHFEKDTVYDYFEEHGGPTVESPRAAWRDAARALARRDAAAFLARQTDAVRAAYAGRLEDQKRRVEAGEADLVPAALGLDRERFLALDPPAYFALCLEFLLAEDLELAGDLERRYEATAVLEERRLAEDRAEVVVRFPGGTTATRALVLEDGRWRVEWTVGDWLPDALREF